MSIFNFKSSVTIVIPIYKSSLSHYEEISIKQCCTILSDHTITLVKPHSLGTDAYSIFNKNFKTESFDNDFFKDKNSYNRLMLSPVFYERFLSYDFILVHQLDAFVFKDELQYWCRQGYDYIGAPWLTDPVKRSASEKKQYLKELKKVYKQNITLDGAVPVDAQFYNRTGNGGFSLRRVKKFYKICLEQVEVIKFYNEQSHHFFNEDVFWSLEVNRTRKQLKIPGYKKAIFFSMEFKPAYAFELTNGKLPFACHAWDLDLDFWKNKIEKFGYVI